MAKERVKARDGYNPVNHEEMREEHDFHIIKKSDMGFGGLPEKYIYAKMSSEVRPPDEVY